jgi:pimeloyl-ACP methyl ester carboxylesterase
VGRSLGSGVAVWLASRRPPSRLILVTPFSSLQEIAAGQFTYFPVTWLMLDKYESWRYAPQITAPTLILQAENDEVIPGASTRALAAHFRKGLVTYQVVPGVGHNTLSLNPGNVKLPEGFR